MMRFLSSLSLLRPEVAPAPTIDLSILNRTSDVARQPEFQDSRSNDAARAVAMGVTFWAAESESRPELGSVGADRYGWSRSRPLWLGSELESAKFRDSGPVSQANTRQQTIILAEGLSNLPKTLIDREKRRAVVCR